MARRPSRSGLWSLAMDWLPRLDRLWWWLALVSAIALLGQEIARSSSALVVAASSFSPDEFEGFGDESEELDDDPELQIFFPSPTLRLSGFETDRGPPRDVDGVVDPPPPQSEVVGAKETASSSVEPQSQPQPSPPQQQQVRHEYWDEDEFEGLPVEETEKQHGYEASGGKDDSTTGGGNQGSSRARPGPIGPQSYYVEGACVAFLIAFAFNFFLGKKENEKIALAWAAHYACKDGLFDKNFSLLGTGDGPDAPLLIKEAQNVFKFYASGRRFCEGLLATMDLQNRHDLLARLWYLVSPRKDEMTIDVYMNDDAMEPIAFAVARKKNVKAMHKEWKDLQQFATTLAPQSQRKWVSEELAVISESRDLALDLLTDAVVDQVLGEKPFEKHGKDLVSIHFTDQWPLGSHRKILQFKFTLPPANRMADITRLIGIVPYFIDLLGRHKLSAQSRSKAEAARAKVAHEAFKETQGARQEALQKKKEERRKALENAESKLSSEALRRKEDRDRRRQIKKSMPKIKMTRAL